MADQQTVRADSTQLPSAAELLDILAKESPRRAINFNLLESLGPIFDSYRRLSRLADSDCTWIDTYKEKSLDSLIDEIKKSHDELILFIQNHEENGALYAEVYNSLILQDDLSKTEAIFVFGAPSNARIERAIELYKAGVSPKIVISGSGPHYAEVVLSEADRMAAFAVDNGVPAEALTVESESITLPDNVKRSIDLFESMDWRPSSLTVVATNFVLARSVMEWHRFCSWEVKVKPVAARPQSAKFTPDGWTKDDSGILHVLNEYAKFILEAKIDLMQRDGEI